MGQMRVFLKKRGTAKKGGRINMSEDKFEQLTEMYPIFDRPPYAQASEIPAGRSQTTRMHETEISFGRRRKKRGGARRGLSMLLLIGCIGFSSLFGFIGGYAANRDGQSHAGAIETGIFRQSGIRSLAAEETGASGMMTIPEAAAAVKDAIVEITTEVVVRSGRMGQLVTTGAGSGVIVSGDGYIVTNNHVVSEARSITVRLTDGSEYAATVRGVDAKTDLAVLKFDVAGLTPAVFGDSSTLVVGDTTLVIGNPLGELGGTVTSGIVSALDREIAIDGETMSLLQTDAAVNPGNSGGGLFNLHGELIGVVNAKSSGSGVEGLGFAIPVNIAKTVIEDLIADGYVKGRLTAGFTLVDIQDAQTAMSYRVNRLGLYISKSADAAFKSGDRIIAVNGAAVSDLAGFNASLAGLSVGDRVEITAVRGGKNITASITLTELRS
jgi:serine protease Do